MSQRRSIIQAQHELAIARAEYDEALTATSDATFREIETLNALDTAQANFDTAVDDVRDEPEPRTTWHRTYTLGLPAA